MSKIAIDTRWVAIKAGVYQHIKNLTTRVVHKDDTHHYTLFGADLGISSLGIKHINLQGYKRRFFQGLWKTVSWPHLDSIIGQQDLVHFTNGVSVPLKNKHTKTILTVHDLAYIHFPETIQNRNLSFLKKHSPRAIKKADHIIAVSEFTKQDIVDTFHINPHKISVIYNDCASPYFGNITAKDIAELDTHLHLPERFILSVATFEPRKNLETLLTAYSMLPVSQRLPLVLVGTQGWKNQSLQQKLAELRSTSQIITPGFITDEKVLASIFAKASLFVFPSLFEGFGMPILESMRSGTPVICSRTSSHPEIADGAAIMFDPSQPAELAEQIHRVLSSSTLQEQLVRAGYAKAQKFSWEESANQVLSVYNKFLK